MDPIHFALGVLVLWAPGLAIAWAFVPGLDWAKFIAASVILGLTIPPALIYGLNLFLGVPIAPFEVTLLALAVASLAFAAGLLPRLERAWS